jgi:hypothetical protein
MDPPAQGPAIFDKTGNLGYQVITTWLLSATNRSLNLVFGGDDGHSLFVDGQFAGGAGYGPFVSNTISLRANVPRKLELVIYNSIGGWLAYIGLAPWTDLGEHNWTNLLNNVPGLHQNAEGFRPALRWSSGLWFLGCALVGSAILLVAVYFRKKTQNKCMRSLRTL